MGADSRVARYAVLAVCGAALLPSCRKKGDGGGPPPAASSAVPVDRLAPGELPPGTETAFGLVLPRGMVIGGVFRDVIFASGKLPPEHVANYVRARVEVQRVELGAAGTVFSSVKIKEGDASRTYRIEVSPARFGSELEVRDITPVPRKPFDPSLTPEDRWRKAGYNADGTPVDPKKLR